MGDRWVWRFKYKFPSKVCNNVVFKINVLDENQVQKNFCGEIFFKFFTILLKCEMRKINIPNGYLLAFFLDDAKILNLIFSQPIIFTFAAHKKILIFCKF